MLLCALLLSNIHADIIDVNRCADPVVKIEVIKNQDHALGSGIILDSNGYVLSNMHVIKDATSIHLFLKNSKQPLKVKIIAQDSDTDIALLKIDLTNNLKLPTAVIATTLPDIGDQVYAVGYPFQTHQSLSQGFVSAYNVSGIYHSKYESFIESDIRLNHGNSGGALCNKDGELIGMNSGIYKGFGFSIDIFKSLHVASVLKEHGFFQHAKLGVLVEDSDTCEGVLIAEVLNNELLEKGDCLKKLNSTLLSSSKELLNLLGYISAGENIVFTLIRESQEFRFIIKTH